MVLTTFFAYPKLETTEIFTKRELDKDIVSYIMLGRISVVESLLRMLEVLDLIPSAEVVFYSVIQLRNKIVWHIQKYG